MPHAGGDGSSPSMYGAADQSPPLRGKPPPSVAEVGEADGSGNHDVKKMEPFSIDEGSFEDEHHDAVNSSERWNDNDVDVSQSSLVPTPTTTSSIPEDRMRWLFGIMGLGTLFPYNAIITCEDYYSELHPDANDVAGQLAAYCLTALLITTILLLPISTPAEGDNGGRKLATTMAVPRGGTACLGCLWRYMTSWLSHPVHRIYLGYSMCLISLLLLAALKQPSMELLNASSFLVGMADATSQSGLYVFAASYHRPTYTAAVTLGSAIAGLAVGVLRLITRGLFDTDSLNGLRKGVAVLYLLSSVVIIGCLWALHAVVRDTRAPVREETPCPIVGGAADIIGEGANAGNSSVGERNGQDEPNDTNDNTEGRFRVYCETFRVTWKPTVAAFFNFFITLSLFPGTISSIESTSEDDDGGGAGGRRTNILSLGDWLPVVLITTFNAADCIGRGLLNIDRLGLARLLLFKRDAVETNRHEDGQEPMSQTVPRKVLFPYMNVLVWGHCFSRVIFYPLFALCILPSEPHPMIASDLVRIVIVLAFGIGNGFVNCASFMIAPTMVTNERHRDASSLLLLLSIYSGLTFGSYFGLVVDRVLRELASKS